MTDREVEMVGILSIGDVDKSQIYRVGLIFLLGLLQGCSSPTRPAMTSTAEGKATVVHSTPITGDVIVSRPQPLMTHISSTVDNITATPTSRGFITYTVQSGDTLFGIAFHFGLRPETSVENNDYALDALGYTLKNDLNGVTTDVVTVQTNLKELQTAVSANKTGTPLPRYTTNDIDTATSIAQVQAYRSTKALNDTKAKAAMFDKQAADLAHQAKQLAANFECP